MGKGVKFQQYNNDKHMKPIVDGRYPLKRSFHNSLSRGIKHLQNHHKIKNRMPNLRIAKSFDCSLKLQHLSNTM